MTAKTVLIHAGLAKTGTTSIQTMLHGSRRALRAQGISTWGHKGFHSRPLATAFGRPERRKATKVYVGKAEDVRAELAAAIAASEPTFVLSAEAVSHFRPDELATFSAFFRDLGVQAKVLVYVRRPDSHSVSLVQQVLRDGRVLSKAVLRTDVLNYPERIGYLFEAFGRDAVDVRLCPEGGDPHALIVDFLEAIGAEPSFSLDWLQPQNGSLSHRAAMLLSTLNGEASSSEARRSYKWLIPLLRTHVPGPPFRLRQDVLDGILARHAQHIRWLEAETGLDLSPRPNGAAPEDAPASDAALAPLLLSLVQQICRLQARVDAAEAQRNDAGAA
jgi:hypothetical protein